MSVGVGIGWLVFAGVGGAVRVGVDVVSSQLDRKKMSSMEIRTAFFT